VKASAVNIGRHTPCNCSTESLGTSSLRCSFTECILAIHTKFLTPIPLDIDACLGVVDDHIPDCKSMVRMSHLVAALPSGTVVDL
jgi:hypothetical protein